MRTSIFIFSFLISLHASSQSKKDTSIIFYDANHKIINAGTASYIARVWKENGNWHKKDYYMPQGMLQMDGMFADEDFKIRNGLFTWYGKSGLMTDSCLYINDKKEGCQKKWTNEGNQTALLHWHQNIPVDTAIWWNTEGKVTAIQSTDSLGNGLYQSFLAGTKTVRVNGPLVAGKRDGHWVFKDSKGILGMEIEYLADSAIVATCYDENGQPESSKTKCIVEKPAAFKGGKEGWTRFIEKKLQYPDYALEHRIQGIVRLKFTIQKDGTLADIEVLSSPHESLSKEALRLLSTSPNWEPAQQYNRYVFYRHIQSITFRLE